MFTIDLRTLACFRIVLGLLITADIANRWRHIDLLYTDAGIMPRESLDKIFGSSMKWTTLHYHFSGSVAAQSILFVAAVAAALMLCLGYRTRWMTLISWGLLSSLNRRLPDSSSAGDVILMILLFWGLFLPMAARWSLDRHSSDSQESKSNAFRSAGTAAILLQVCYIYWFTVAFKWHPDWLEGRALGQALRLDMYARPLAIWLESESWITVPLTYATLAIEALAPFIVFTRRPLLRWIGIGTMWCLHLGIAMCFDIGVFPYVSLLCWVLFIPGATWDWLGRMERWTSWTKRIRRCGQVLCGVLPKGSEVSIEPSRYGSIFVVVLLLFVTIYNILGLPYFERSGVRIPSPITTAARVLRLHQKWAMFAPTPNVPDSWFMMPAELRDGSLIDVWLNRTPPSYDKPSNLVSTFPDFRVNRIMFANRNNQRPEFWRGFAKSIVRRWNENAPRSRQIVRMQIIGLVEQIHNQKVTIQVLVDHQISDRAVEDAASNRR